MTPVILSMVDKARVAWGGSAPDWVRELAGLADDVAQSSSGT